MLGTPYQTKLTFLANLLTILRILLQWKLDYDSRSLSKSRVSREEFYVNYGYINMRYLN